MGEPVDVVVLGSGLNALGVVRSLGKAGLRIALVSQGEAGIAARSRFVSIVKNLPSARWTASGIAGSLQLGDHRPVLLLTEELDVQYCVSDTVPWQERFQTYFHTPDVAKALLSKAECDGLAKRACVPAPRTAVLANADSLDGVVEFRFPVVVKPAQRDQGYSARFEKAYRVDSSGELVQLIERLREVDVDLVVQEWIEGGDADIFFNILYTDSQGESVCSFVGRKVYCWPPRVGGTASCIATPEFHETLTSQSREFLDAIDFRGFIGMEYKRDRRDGVFYLIEPTVYRTDYQHEIAALSGENVLLHVFDDCSGRPRRQPARYDASVYWDDFPASRYSASESDRTNLTSTAKRVDAYFRWNDPVPGLLHYGRFFGDSIKSRLRRR